MELTHEAIEQTHNRIPGIKGYQLHVLKIEKNLSSNPDITIETCKSLIEGLCLKALGLTSKKFQESKSLQGKCKNNFSLLVETAFEHVYARGMEAQLHISLSEVIGDAERSIRWKKHAAEKLQKDVKKSASKITAIRDQRGDISHGRDYPKDVESEVALSKSIRSITDGVCSYMILELAKLVKEEAVEEREIKYDANKDFNQWLDNRLDLPVSNLNLSRLIYDEDYDEYKRLLERDYQEFLENEHEEEMYGLPERAVLINELPPFPSEEEQEELAELARAIDAGEITYEDGTPYNDETKAKEEPKTKYKKAVPTETFEEKRKGELMVNFAKDEGLTVEVLAELVEEFLFSEKIPLRDELEKAFIEKPKGLKERKERLNDLEQKLTDLVDQIRILEVK